MVYLNFSPSSSNGLKWDQSLPVQTPMVYSRLRNTEVTFTIFWSRKTGKLRPHVRATRTSLRPLGPLATVLRIPKNVRTPRP